MVHDIKEQTSSEELYKNKYRQLVDCINKLCDHLLGEGYVIYDSVDEATACKIITDDIIRNYNNVNNTLDKKLGSFIKKQIDKMIHEN